MEITKENKVVLLIVCVAKCLGERSLWLYEKVGQLRSADYDGACY